MKKVLAGLVSIISILVISNSVSAAEIKKESEITNMVTLSDSEFNVEPSSPYEIEGHNGEILIFDSLEDVKKYKSSMVQGVSLKPGIYDPQDELSATTIADGTKNLVSSERKKYAVRGLL